MSCGHCVAAVTAELTKIGASHVDVDLATGSVSFVSPAELDPARIAEAIDEAGFELAT